MDESRGLRGTVRTKDGWAVRHAIVTVTDLAGNQVAREQTGEDGVLAAGPLPAGTYTVITGNKPRDDHLRSADFLNVDEHPVIEYAGDRVGAAGPDRWTVHGRLTLNGHTRPVDLDLAYLGTGADPWGGVRAAFRATAELRREDFGIRYNELLEAGIAMVGESLRVELEIQAVRGTELPQG